MEEKTTNKANYLIKNIPTDTYRLFAAKVKLNGQTIRGVLLHFIANYGKYMNNYEEEK